MPIAMKEVNQMNREVLLGRWVPVLVLLATIGPAAQTYAKDPPGKPAAAGAAMAEKTSTVTGPVKGAPSGKTFMISRKGETITVDASGAKIREKGKFTSVGAIKGGTMVTAKGALQGTTLKATEVTVHSRGGGGTKAAGKK
jgi:hypothetical protein